MVMCANRKISILLNSSRRIASHAPNVTFL